MVREAQKPGAVRQEVARRNGVHVSVLNRWRTEERVSASGAKKAVKPLRLLPVRVRSPRLYQRPSQPVEATIAVAPKFDTIDWSYRVANVSTCAGWYPLMLRAVLQELSQS